MDWEGSSDNSFQDSDNQVMYAALQANIQNHQEQPKGESSELKAQQNVQQIGQFTEQNISCQICCKYAINAVLCSNEKCKKLFCTACIDSYKNNGENKCPFCRVSPFTYKKSPFAQKINRIEINCQLCKQKYALKIQQKHYRQCKYFHVIRCRYCSKQLQQKQIIKHTRQYHEKQIDQLIQNLYKNPSPYYDYRNVLSDNKIYLEKIGKNPHLGTTGKFYCGKKLQTKCTCCNGFCGPTNGQNCSDCMKLDIKRFGLTKGYLINSGGMICFLSGNEYVCGTRMYYDTSYCKQGNTCRPCTNMKRNIKRYEHLI